MSRLTSYQIRRAMRLRILFSELSDTHGYIASMLVYLTKGNPLQVTLPEAEAIDIFDVDVPEWRDFLSALVKEGLATYHPQTATITFQEQTEYAPL